MDEANKFNEANERNEADGWNEAIERNKAALEEATSPSSIAVADTVPPVIAGELDKYAAVGGTVSYRAGVFVTDDRDPNPMLTVDSSKVNLRAEGTYPVYYYASDESGNESMKEGTVTVRAVDSAYVDEIADGVLKRITDDSMSDYDKAYAIFMWVAKKVAYTAANSPRDMVNGAYACFVKGSGDCYVYMAGSRALLSRAGIRNEIVQRIGGTAEHYWLLVNAGGGWYHFDACDNKALAPEERFMFSESKAREYTERIAEGREFYVYDKSTVPLAEEE